MGHEQPYNIVAILACERLLPSGDLNQPLNVAIPKFPILNGRFHQQQSFKLLEKPFCEGLESAERTLQTKIYWATNAAVVKIELLCIPVEDIAI